jgi:hypothetical protein
MAETDWTFLTDELTVGQLDRGITSGFVVPNGGGSFTFGFNSLVTAQGAAGLFTNQAGFAPTAALKGGSIRGAIKRGLSAGDANFAPFFFIQCQGTSVNDHAYLLGLTDEEPARIILAKVPIVGGLPANPVVGQDGVLALSTTTFNKDTFLHLRLDCIVNANGDVLLQAFQNADLVTNPVTAPVWTTIAGLSNFVDDQLGVNSGDAGVTAGFEQPFTSGRMGFGFFSKDISRRGVFDHIEAFVQS